MLNGSPKLKARQIQQKLPLEIMQITEVKKVPGLHLTFWRGNIKMQTKLICWNVTGSAGLTNSVAVLYAVWLMQYTMLFDGAGYFFERGQLVHED